MIPKLALQHKVFSSVDPVVGQISKFERKVSHFDRSLVEYLGILFISDLEEVDEPNGGNNNGKVDNEQEVDELRLFEWQHLGIEWIKDLVSHAE